MGIQTARIFFVLFVISTGIVLFTLSRRNLSQSISWTAFSGKFKHRDGDSKITVLDNKGNSTPSPAVSPTTTHKAKITDSVTTNPVTEFKTDVTRTSTHGAVAETPMPVLYKSSFKKLPKWDFEDKYYQDAPPRQTPSTDKPNTGSRESLSHFYIEVAATIGTLGKGQTCAQSLRKSEDESFKKAFLPNIRLFMHKDNINMSEWNRLSHFNNPFGFMGYKYDEVMASAKLISKPKEPLLLPVPGSDGCVRCAVVATSGILYGSKLGKEIDAHDYVFRMNGAVIKGFEEDVGNKTSVYVHTAHSITSASYTLKKYGYKSVPHDEGIKYVMIPEGMRDFQWLQGLLKGERVSAGPYRNKRPRTYYAQQYNETRFYVLHQDFLRYVRNRFLSSHILNSVHWGIVRPTNGAFTLFLALQTCDIVDAYGFITGDHKKYSNYYYQRNAKTHVVYYINHDYTVEMNMWKKLHNSKIIRLYQRTDPETEKPKQ